MKHLNYFTNILKKIQTTLGVSLLITFLVSVFIQIIARYMRLSILWTEELATYSFAFAVFMGASVMVKENGHFAFSYMINKLDGNKKKFLQILIYSIMLAFVLTSAIYGVTITKTFWNYNWTTLPSLKMGYVWLSLPISMFTMSLYLIEHILTTIFITNSKLENLKDAL